MSMYAIAHIVHLLCAVIFVGGILFEALVLSVLHSKAVSRAARQEVEHAISHRATRVMPVVVALLFASGLVMLHRHAAVLWQPFAHSFHTQLALKIVLAISVLAHFVFAVYKMKRHTLTKAWSRYIHIAVAMQVICIVLLAKTMFYVAW